MLSVFHAQLRMGCNSLHFHLSLILHVKEDPSCLCGQALESPKHFFLECQLYAGPRAQLVDLVNSYTDHNINVLLFGDHNLNFHEI